MPLCVLPFLYQMICIDFSNEHEYLSFHSAFQLLTYYVVYLCKLLLFWYLHTFLFCSVTLPNLCLVLSGLLSLVLKFDMLDLFWCQSATIIATRCTEFSPERPPEGKKGVLSKEGFYRRYVE